MVLHWRRATCHPYEATMSTAAPTPYPELNEVLRELARAGL